jgi:peptidoglycan-N-acetylglucosamine deacetylase
MNRPIASLSLDLDNKWAYLKARGDRRWETFPSYFNTVVPRIVDTLKRRGLDITFFVVGQDAALPANHDAISRIVQAGHEVANHSFHHEPWLQLYSPDQVREEFDASERAIKGLTGYRPIGFRGPGYSFSDTVLDELVRRQYAYDASTFPTFLGPVARAYYFLKTGLKKSEREERKQLFGSFRDGLRPLNAHRWPRFDGELLEIPVTTFPLVKSPIHLTYLVYLSRFSRTLALGYFRAALAACRMTGVTPSFLIHPLDFLGGDDEPDLDFFPGMDIKAADKIAFVERVFDVLQDGFRCVTMHQHAAIVLGRRLDLGMPPAARLVGEPA